jgi:hypothetical protein
VEHLGGEVGVGGRGEHHHLGGVDQPELFGLFAEALGGDGVAVPERHVVARDLFVEVDQPSVESVLSSPPAPSWPPLRGCAARAAHVSARYTASP